MKTLYVVGDHYPTLSAAMDAECGKHRLIHKILFRIWWRLPLYLHVKARSDPVNRILLSEEYCNKVKQLQEKL